MREWEERSEQVSEGSDENEETKITRGNNKVVEVTEVGLKTD